MRISKEQREKTIDSILSATAKLSKKKGFKAISMKSIAKEAGIGEATIYNYYATKESLIFGYFERSLTKAFQQMEKEREEGFTFVENVHTLLESHLDLLKSDVVFVEEVFNYMFVNPLFLGNSALADSKKAHYAAVRELFEQSLQAGEFADPPFRSFLLELLWDFHVGAIYYWIKDESKNKIKTTEMIDLALQLFHEILACNLLGKIYGLSHFLIKEHLLSKLFNRSSLGNKNV